MADHEATKIDKANHLLLDQPLLRLPYELLRKNFRSAHFIVEKESAAVKNALKDAATAGLRNAGSASSTDDVLRSIDSMVARMRGMKRKLEACAEEEAKIYRHVDARTAHLAELASMHTLDDVAYESWSRRRLDRLLVDYLLRHGYNKSAAALVADHDNDAAGSLRDLVDMDTFEQMAQIRQRLLRDHSVTEALAWCSENKKELRKMESRLEFMLRFQQFIEMVRSEDTAKLADAITHARRYLTPLHNTYPEECQQASVLMCYPAGEAPEDYSALWNDERWAMLADLFTTTYYQLLSLPSVPLLHLALSSGLSALKTPACHSSTSVSVDEDTAQPVSALPPTLPSLATVLAMPTSVSGSAGAPGSMRPPTNLESLLLSGVLGPGVVHATLPEANVASNAHGNGNNTNTNGNGNTNGTSNGNKSQASLFAHTSVHGQQMGSSVCPICSIELNELARHVPYAHHSKSHVEHDLLLLPNGHVYGKAKLEEYARKTGLPAGEVRDLRTGDVFQKNKLLKVYIT
ncbi:GID complex subunit containing RING finger motif [Sporothrix bragantina]|uniref:GID complex subunit containing RING finger motif n=1 Tax=Sporothrix bragantina TaxID=671064 RepID=A0ABP0B3I4_9PEZI